MSLGFGFRAYDHLLANAVVRVDHDCYENIQEKQGGYQSPQHEKRRAKYAI